MIERIGKPQVRERESYLVQLTIWYETIVVNIVDPDILKDYDSNWCLLHSEAQKYFVRHLFASYLHHLVWYEFMQVKGVIMSIEFIGTVLKVLYTSCLQEKNNPSNPLTKKNIMQSQALSKSNSG